MPGLALVKIHGINMVLFAASSADVHPQPLQVMEWISPGCGIVGSAGDDQADLGLLHADSRGRGFGFPVSIISLVKSSKVFPA